MLATSSTGGIATFWAPDTSTSRRRSPNKRPPSFASLRLLFISTFHTYYVGLACKRMSILGLDQYEIQDLIDSCQQSCGMCTPPPSMLPSSVPSTEKPSSSPTTSPSNAPTHFPSLVLSGSPSDLPSELPVVSPSTRPSMVPSLIPSMFPSSEPSISSSTAPSESPSSNPSNSCHDVATFRNRIGRACTDFSNTMPCENYISLGFSHNDV